jgi:hypothetical protein
LDQPWVIPAIISGLVTAVVLLVLIANRKPIKCAACGTEQPKFRKPANATQAMMGGRTCTNCGAELDANGQVTAPKKG